MRITQLYYEQINLCPCNFSYLINRMILRHLDVCNVFKYHDDMTDLKTSAFIILYKSHLYIIIVNQTKIDFSRNI